MKKILLFTSILFLTITSSLFAQHPTNIVASNLTTTSVNLEWDESMCASFVNLKFRVSGSGAAGWNYLNGLASPQLLSGLTPNTAYELALKCSGVPGWSTAFDFSTLLPLTIDTAFIIQPISCYGDNTGEIQSEISQTTTPTTYSYVVGYFNPSIPGYFTSVKSGGQSTVNTFIVDFLLADVDYFVRIVDSSAYWSANGGVASGTDTSGIYDEFGPITLLEPGLLVASDFVITSNLCVGDCIAATDLLISGGTSPYAFTLDGGMPQDLAIGDSTFSFTGLCEGQYDIVVTDANSCSTDPQTISFTITEPDIITLSGVVNVVNSNGFNISCNGASDGEITAVASGGTGVFTYSIDGASFQSSPIFPNLAAGTYTITYKDANNCIASETFTLNEPPVLSGTVSSPQISCLGGSTGEASANVSGGIPFTGIPAYTYLWDDALSQTTNSASSLGAGNYTVIVTDNNNCTFTGSVDVLADTGFLVTMAYTSPCLGPNTGGASVASSGAVQPPSYQWSDVNGVMPGETSISLFNVPIGMYSVLVTGSDGCSKVGSVEIIENSNQIVIDSLVVTNISCFDISDAQIEILASGGTPNPSGNYNYSITNLDATLPSTNQSSNIFNSLGAFSYSLQAIDDIGCFDDTIITLSNPDLLEIDSTVFTDISCFGLNDGAIQNIQFVGGTGPFEFSADGGPTQTYMLFSGLEPGQHTVEVFDVNNCASSDFITIIEPTLFEFEATVSNWNNYQIRCSGDSLGYVDILSSGGIAPYLTDGITFSNTITIDSLWAGNHTFIVQDANGCSYQETILFNEPGPIQHNFISTHINCAAWNDGSVIDSVYGGVGSATTYSYLWDSGETTYSLVNLALGTYTITVTDENGCEDKDSVTINDDNVFQASAGSTLDVSCFDDCDGELNVIVSGGIPFVGLTSYSYLWNDYLGQISQSAVGLCVDSITLSTDYYCVVSDALGCSDTINFTLEQPEELQVDISITSPISCNGKEDGTLNANVTGGEEPASGYTYTWSNGDITSQISDLPLGIYKVIVEDANTCRDTFEIYLNEPTLMEISIQEFDISCFGDDDGSIEVLGNGGNSFEATYSYTLYSGTEIVDAVIDYEAGSIYSGSQTPFIFTSLSSGNYYVIATDRNGCDVTSLSVEITEPFEPLTLLVDTVDETCSLGDGIIRMFPEGGSQSFNYYVADINGIQINGTQTNSNIIFGNLPGLYFITVTDTRGCKINDTTFIKDFRKIFLPDALIDIDTTICLGQSILINVDERPDLIYTWNDGVETGDRIIMPEVMLAYGADETLSYTLTITDTSLNCFHENNVSVHLNSIDPMLESDPAVEYGVSPIVLAGNPINLFSENNDVIEYTWKWSNDTITNTNASITIQAISETNWYYLSVKDPDGCLGYDSVYVVVGVKPYEAITPNNDGFNDTWTPLDIRSYQNALVQVFNRWGGLVFESSGGNNFQAWDGTNYGKELAVGTYYYIIDLNTGDEPQTGPVTIIR